MCRYIHADSCCTFTCHLLSAATWVYHKLRLKTKKKKIFQSNSARNKLIRCCKHIGKYVFVPPTTLFLFQTAPLQRHVRWVVTSFGDSRGSQWLQLTTRSVPPTTLVSVTVLRSAVNNIPRIRHSPDVRLHEGKYEKNSLIYSEDTTGIYVPAVSLLLRPRLHETRPVRPSVTERRVC